MIGAGGIASAHLDAYRTAGFNVLDITPHPEDRLPLIEKALMARKHVLSQKPFVLDLETGARLIQMAADNDVKLAVNQNGRWAPHMAYMREAVHAGLIGDVTGCHVAIHWDHSWIAGTSFETMEDLIFHDFGIHWFDFLASLVGHRMRSVFAMHSTAAGQTVKPPMLAQALVRLDDGQASLVFDAATPFGSQDSTYIAGTCGSVSSIGPDLGRQTVTLNTRAGHARPELTGTWFNDGFRGAMGELLCAVEDDREPSNNARDNMKSLALAFAAMESARKGVEISLNGHY